MRGKLPGSPITDNMLEARNVILDNPLKMYNEAELLYDRKYTCPVCGKEFASKAVRTGKALPDGMDFDLRQRFVNLDPIKYYVLECPKCGYADMESTFEKVNRFELEELRKNKAVKSLAANLPYGIRDHAEALMHYKSAMRCDLVRKAKYGKRGYTALHTAWLLRSWRVALHNAGEPVSDGDPMSEKEEFKLLKYAYTNFREAELKESFPINGVKESTFDYIMAALSYMLDKKEESYKYVMRVLHNDDLTPVLRIKAEDLQNTLRKER
jgi:uncharacterized protein (DUF2225 family)